MQYNNNMQAAVSARVEHPVATFPKSRDTRRSHIATNRHALSFHYAISSAKTRRRKLKTEQPLILRTDVLAVYKTHHLQLPESVFK
jgi:hypothetical protein